MNKKNIYLAQPSYMSSNSAPFPAAIGALSAYAWRYEDIKEFFLLKDIIFLREKQSEIINRLDSPFLFGFSSYMWNIEYNKALAEKVKARFPNCVILFGGPQVPEGEELLESCPFIDVLIHSEGEIPFLELLRALRDKTPLDKIKNISFRDGEKLVYTGFERCCSTDFPSPVTSGFFDRLISENPGLRFTPLIESGRGCPNRCAYCSWGNKDTGMRLFPLERVFGDLEWISRHKMEYIGFADSNFGMFKRDEEITEKILELNKKNGYPKKFQVSYAKDSGERVYNITEKLNEAGLCKGVTLSFQTMSPEAQKNIGRSNMDIEYYKFLLRKYADAGISTYSELILGLPGETVESFISGIEQLLEYGQHAQMMIHLCEWLPLSPMGEKEYLEKYKIKYIKIPLNQPHVVLNADDEIPEFSRVVVSSYSMSAEEWKQVTLFGASVLCFHHLGLMQLPALYLFFEKGIKYVDFYSRLLSSLLSKENSVFNRIKKQLDDMLENGAGAVVFDERFGKVSWTFEEYAFLSAVFEKEAFYKEMDAFLSFYISDDAFRRELLSYQAFTVKEINRPYAEFKGNYNWREYFSSLLKNKRAELIKREVNYFVNDEFCCASWSEYAEKVVWYGRRGGKNIYSSEIKERFVDGQ
ncbi:MAG: radical SAM protein [Oscillospiraceae bacterium]|nr:radical SAM protein [Oscillospiraceae bacterium]